MYEGNGNYTIKLSTGKEVILSIKEMEEITTNLKDIKEKEKKETNNTKTLI